MKSSKVEGPCLPTLEGLKNHLRAEPLYFQMLDDYFHRAVNLGEIGGKLASSGNIPPCKEMFLPPSQEQLEVFREISLQQYGLNKENENKGQVMLHLLQHQEMEPEDLEEKTNANEEEEMEMAERRQVTSHGLFLNEVSVGAVPRAPAVVPKRRKLVKSLRSWTIKVPIAEQERNKKVPVEPEAFHVPAMEGLPAQYREILTAPESAHDTE
ncbi:unnamed protein product [Cercopithifilaria johnstoni]|uniref:Uncharacterized protein n=1 Tax=Cercopithifilaria johnstoni TaxID=2874296 RepID=A0A8J2PQS4_9BILA|nr:unnamed protein product [Cercopithifilaria johnstoni]